VDRYLERTMATRLPSLDANDLLYQVDASRDYDPEPRLDAIEAPLVHVNSSDDFINPPELGIAEREIQKVKHGRFVLVPASDQTHGHGTHTWATFWKDELRAMLESPPRERGGRLWRPPRVASWVTGYWPEVSVRLIGVDLP
jgi:homoserine O-acetyltransferase